MKQETILIILLGTILGAAILTTILLYSFGFFKPKEKANDDEIEANAMVSPPPLSSDNTLANNHNPCCCKQHKQPTLPVKRAKHISEQ